MFIVGTPTQIYRFLASSEREKEKWESQLKKCIEKEKQAFVEVRLNIHIKSNRGWYCNTLANYAYKLSTGISDIFAHT